MLGEILKEQAGLDLYNSVEELRQLAIKHRETQAQKDKLADKLADAFDRVWRLADEQGLSLRSAALVAGIREVGAALTARGIYP